MMINRSLLFELELNEYLDITTSKAQIVSVFVTSCLLDICNAYAILNVVCFEDDVSFETPPSLFSKVEALDEGSVRLKDKIGGCLVTFPYP